MFTNLIKCGRHQMLGGIHKQAWHQCCLSEHSVLMRLCCYLRCLITPLSLCNCTLQTASFSSLFHLALQSLGRTSIKHWWPVLCSIISLTLLPFHLYFCSRPLISRRLTENRVWHSIWLHRGEHDGTREWQYRKQEYTSFDFAVNPFLAHSIHALLRRAITSLGN